MQGMGGGLSMYNMGGAAPMQGMGGGLSMYNMGEAGLGTMGGTDTVGLTRKADDEAVEENNEPAKADIFAGFGDLTAFKKKTAAPKDNPFDF